MAPHQGHPSIIGRVFASTIIGRRCQVARTIIGLARPTVTWGAHLVLIITTTITNFEDYIVAVFYCIMWSTFFTSTLFMV